MVTKTEVIKDKRPFATVEAIREVLVKEDFQLWFDRRKIKAVKGWLSKKLDQRISGRRLKEARGACKWWKKMKRVSESRNNCPSESQWAALREAVLRHKNEIAGKSIEHAAAILCCYHRCNVSTQARNYRTQGAKFWCATSETTARNAM